MVRRNTERRVVETGRAVTSLYVLLGRYGKLIMDVSMEKGSRIYRARWSMERMVESLSSTLKREETVT